MEKDNLNNLKNEPSPPERKWLFLVFTIPIVLLILGYGLFAYAAQEYILPFVKYQGQDVGLKTFPEITKIVLESEKKIKKQPATLNFDGKNETRSLEELGISIQSSKTTDAVFNYGKKSFFISLPTLTYFENLLKSRANAPVKIKKSPDTEQKISEMFEESKKDPISPTIGLENNALVIKQEEPGFKLDVYDFEYHLEATLNSGVDSVIPLKKINTKPNYTANDLMQFKNEIEGLIDKTVYLQSDYKKLQLKKEEILKFVDLEMTVLNQKLSLSDKAVEDYLNSVSKFFNAKGRTKKISSIDNAVIDEGSEGRMLDINNSKKNIIEALEKDSKTAALVVTTAPIKEEVISPGYNLDKFPGKFIEVNLAQQMLYTIENNRLLGSYRVSTGKWSMPTPEGEYTINNKVARAYSSRYDLYMPYWMAFIGSEYGIHELPEWANGTKEGESHLGTPVSHGCVRLGRGSAQEVYSWAEIGTSIFIHR